MRKSVGIEPNTDGSWTAWIYSTRFTGTYDQCLDWLKANNESP